MVNRSGLIIAGAILLAGLTAAVALGATYAPNNIGGVNYSAPKTSAQGPSPYPGRGMMGGGRGMMGYAGSNYPGNGTGSLSWMWSRCAQFMGSLWQTPGQSPQANQVIATGYSFAPQVITVKVGATVTWTNYDSVAHSINSGTASAPTSLFDSGDLAQGQSFSYTFTQAGVYAYNCDLHPGMTGVVIVEA